MKNTDILRKINKYKNARYNAMEKYTYIIIEQINDKMELSFAMGMPEHRVILDKYRHNAELYYILLIHYNSEFCYTKNTVPCSEFSIVFND